MELKDSAVGLIISASLLLAMGLFTGGIVFYAFFAGTVAIILGDLYRYRSYLGDLRRHLNVCKKLSVRELIMGSPVTISYELEYSGRKIHSLRCHQPIDRSLATADLRQGVNLQHGKELVEFTVRPARRGEYAIPGLRMGIDSWLFRGTVIGGGEDRIKVYTALGRAQDRNTGRSSLRYSMIPGSEATRKGTGSDFSTVREYTPGDSTKNIDWARSSRSDTLVVRDFEDVRSLPLYFLIDVDPSMDTGEGESELESAVRLAAALSSRVLQDNERVGLGCFSSADIVLYRPLGSGKEQLSLLRQTFSTLKTATDSQAVRMSASTLQETLTVRKDFADAKGLEALSAIIDDSIQQFSANVKQDGFLKAITRASQSGTTCHMIVITNLSMGIASLLNGVRIARYYGHNVTVVLIPHIWYQPKEGVDAGKYFEQYRTTKDVMARLRSLRINVIELNAVEKPEEALLGTRTRSSNIGR